MYIGMSFNTVDPKEDYRNKGTINYFQPEQSDSAHTFIFSQVWATLYIYSYYFKCVYQKDSSPLRVPDIVSGQHGNKDNFDTDTDRHAMTLEQNY